MDSWCPWGQCPNKKDDKDSRKFKKTKDDKDSRDFEKNKSSQNLPANMLLLSET